MYFKYSGNKLITCGLLVSTPDSHASDGWFESDQKPTTHGEAVDPQPSHLSLFACKSM